MSKSENINLLKYQNDLRLRTLDNRQKVFDPVRKKWYILQHEEIVRQLILLYLIRDLGYPLSLIAVEKQLEVNKAQRRFDIVVFDTAAHPYILIECKSPKEKLSQGSALQIANYNLALKARYLWLSNGQQNLFYDVDFEKEKTALIEHIPDYASMSGL